MDARKFTDGGIRTCKTNCFNGRRYSWSETTQRKRRGVYCPSAKTMAVMPGAKTSGKKESFASGAEFDNT